eukprot:Phypoly_transcript_06210.p1 GENE.Phypoly_transcript_06210~~Phypoly_transcript_06210.p1  ORF type:complete len:456 (+),score=53.48 Phypoly_transcript_06210:169-1536(+)
MKYFVVVLLLLCMCYFHSYGEPSFMGARMDFGEITLEPSASYQLVCLAEGGYYVAPPVVFWNPLPNAASDMPPVRPLGHMVRGAIEFPQDSASLLVGPSKTANTSKPPLADPVDYTALYNTTYSYLKGSEFTIWQPVPPAGYVALGLVVGCANTKPATNIIYTVRKDLAMIGAIDNSPVWTTKLITYSYAQKAALYNISAPGISFISDFSRAMLAPNTFMFQGNFDTPVSNPVAYVLYLPMPSTSNVTDKLDLVPKLNSCVKPADQTESYSDRSVYVPMTAFHEPHLPTQQQAKISPFYRIRRITNFHLQVFQNNQGTDTLSTTKTITYGVSNSRANTFDANIGREVSLSAGVIGGPTITASFRLDLGYTYSTKIVEFSSSALATTLRTPSEHCSAIYSSMDSLSVIRMDDSLVKMLTYNPAGEARVVVEYPRPAKARSVQALTEVEVEVEEDDE